MTFQEAMNQIYEIDEELESAFAEDSAEVYVFDNSAIDWLVSKATDVGLTEGILDLEFSGVIPSYMRRQVETFFEVYNGRKAPYSPTAGVSIRAYFSQWKGDNKIRFNYTDYRNHPEFSGIH